MRNLLNPLFLVTLLVFASNTFAQTPEQIKFYSERIEFGTDEVKRNALFDLRNFRTESASRLAAPALKDSSEIVRATATSTVIFLPKDESAKVLIPLLSDKDEFVRRETVYALGKTRNPNVATELIKLLQNDKKQSVKDASAVSLGLIGNPNAIKSLTQILQKKPKKKQKFFRRAAARSIGQIAESIKEIKPTLITPKNFLPTKYKDLEKSDTKENKNASAIFIEAENIMKLVIQNPKEVQDVRREAAFALGAIGNPNSIQILRSNLNSEDLYLAEICKEALLRIEK